jgi:hypothetical protein
MTYVIPKKSILETVYNESIYQASLYNSILSTDAEDDITTEWSNLDANGADLTFTQGQFVQVSSLKRVYRCASATSFNEYPPANPTIWTDYGAVNSYKMFDDVINSQTTFTTSCVFSLENNSTNTISFLNLSNINSIRVVQTDNISATTVYDKTFDLTDYGVLSLYDYWYKPVRYKQDLVLDDLYFLHDSTVTITLNSNGIGKVGAVVTGLADDIGLTLYGTSVDVEDYSKYLVDEYGNTTFSKRGYARIINGQVMIDNNLVNDTVAKLAELRGSITLFIGDERKDGYSVLTTLGFIKGLKIALKNPNKTKYPIKIIGVI